MADVAKKKEGIFSWSGRALQERLSQNRMRDGFQYQRSEDAPASGIRSVVLLLPRHFFSGAGKI